MRFSKSLVLITLSALVHFKTSAWPLVTSKMVVIFVNGKFCKYPKQAKAKDFFYSGLNQAGTTNNRVKSNVTTVNVDQIPGLNTLGISLVRIDYAPYGQNPPHTHPRATEILVLVEGTLYVGFVSSNQDNNRLFAKVLNPGDVFVFPIGMIYFQVNIGKTPQWPLLD
ncbi:unnamed protein product [Arabidopsis lyrata]|uniref:Germin-like protein n=1 Tax=Arabidopsis lyrata subsp. lyrata TaxID=81972 RepID=D7MJR6_ARALL|nr:predicted protein [Arabidopsis lyrata subsp. lyrata]CAH8277492.1 unnamed protein product [Arabidopsis lyrata]